MSLFDLILVILLGGFTLYGLWFGFIHTLGSLVGVVFGAFGAGRLFEPIAMKLLWLFGGNENLARIVVFMLIFTIGNRLVGLLFSLVDRTFTVLTIIPFLSSINRLAGAVFGFLEGSLVLGGVLLLVTKFPLAQGFMTALGQSSVAAYLLSVAGVLMPLFPQLVRQLDSVLPYKIPFGR